MNSGEIASRLLEWYERNARDLPWRNIKNPYATWVSEVMLQQTRVETVIPYYTRWLTRFPDLAGLARASQQDVLTAWEGLGYYSRARSLHEGAREVVKEYGGVLPASRAELEKIPGIGPYTAGAIASIAFGAREVALDGNIRRVYARLFAIETPLKGRETESQLRTIACRELPLARAGDYNQALMDLGAMVCTPRNPQCALCPLTGCCLAYQQGRQAEIPPSLVKPAVPHYPVTAGILSRPVEGNGGVDREVLIARRPEKGLLGGLWEFPGGKLEENETLEACLRRELREELGVEVQVGQPFGVYRHAYTHFRVTLHAFFCELVGGSDPKPIIASQLLWASIRDLSNYPMGKIDRQIANKLAGE